MADYYISGPAGGLETRDRAQDCEAQLEPLFRVVMDLAQSAGWSSEEVCHAFMNLADNHLLAKASQTDFASQIAAAIKRIGKQGPGSR